MYKLIKVSLFKTSYFKSNDCQIFKIDFSTATNNIYKLHIIVTVLYIKNHIPKIYFLHFAISFLFPIFYKILKKYFNSIYLGLIIEVDKYNRLDKKQISQILSTVN